MLSIDLFDLYQLGHMKYFSFHKSLVFKRDGKVFVACVGGIDWERHNRDYSNDLFISRYPDSMMKYAGFRGSILLEINF